MRFDTIDEARAAGEWVAQNVTPVAGKFLLIVDVPARNRPNPNADKPADVRVDW
jgi:hypothetical protein